MFAEIGTALTLVRSNLQKVCKTLNLKYEPTLVAVSKTKPVPALQACYDHGQRHFGENYVNEIIEKAPQLPKDIKWHFIGHLQTNKAKKIAAIPNLYMVETIDSEKLASTLNKACEHFARPERLKVLVQVNTSGEGTKSGVPPSECTALCQYVAESCPFLEFAGLMTIGLYNPGPEGDKCFASLMSCKAELVNEFKKEEKKLPDPAEFVVSMGMSSDYESAIKHGSTNIRVGSTIFGARDYSKAADTGPAVGTDTATQEAGEEKKAEGKDP